MTQLGAPPPLTSVTLSRRMHSLITQQILFEPTLVLRRMIKNWSARNHTSTKLYRYLLLRGFDKRFSMLDRTQCWLDVREHETCKTTSNIDFIEQMWRKTFIPSGSGVSHVDSTGLPTKNKGNYSYFHQKDYLKFNILGGLTESTQVSRFVIIITD